MKLPGRKTNAECPLIASVRVRKGRNKTYPARVAAHDHQGRHYAIVPVSNPRTAAIVGVCNSRNNQTGSVHHDEV